VVPRDDGRVDGPHHGVGRRVRPAVTTESMLRLRVPWVNPGEIPARPAGRTLTHLSRETCVSIGRGL
jgi:hypothetical protein